MLGRSRSIDPGDSSIPNKLAICQAPYAQLSLAGRPVTVMPLLLPSRSSPLPSTLRHRLCSYSYSYSVARGGHLLCSRHWPRARRLHAALAADSRVVLGCGLVTLDYLATVDAYPRPDDKIRTGKLQISGGGNAGNALTAAARLGLNTRVISKVIYRGTHWIRFWSLLLREEERSQVTLGCRALETTVMEIFASNGWCFINRIGYA